VLYLH